MKHNLKLQDIDDFYNNLIDSGLDLVGAYTYSQYALLANRLALLRKGDETVMNEILELMYSKGLDAPSIAFHREFATAIMSLDYVNVIRLHNLMDEDESLEQYRKDYIEIYKG